MKKKMKKASYGMKRRKMGGDYMEPNKEIKFGAVKGKKRKKAQQSTGPFDADPISGAPKAGGRVNTTDPMTGRNAASGDNMRTATKSNKKANTTSGYSSVGRPLTQSSSKPKTETKAEAEAEDKTKTESNANTKAKTETKTETKKESESQTKTTEKKSNPYSDAKAKDPKLDSYIKERNRLRDSGKKGSAEYNAVQNKINAAYGKGPTNRPTSGGSSSSSSSSNKTTTGTTPPDRRTPASDSEKKTETKSNTKSTPSTSSDTESSYKPTTKKGRRIQKRGMKKTDRINKRAFNQDSRQLKKKTTKDMKDLGLSGKVARKAGKVAKATFKGKTVKAALAKKSLGKAVRKENEKRLKRADVDRARASAKANVQEAKGRKRATMGAMGVASTIGGMAGNAMQNSDNPTAQKIGKGLAGASNIAGAVSGGGDGAKAKKGRYKAKFGMLSVKAGIDNNPKPTAADRIAGAKMKDRRSKKKKK
jgi:hypothetical protein